MNIFKVYRPIKTDRITQKFGEEKAMVKLGSNGLPIRPFIVKGVPASGIPAGWTGFYTAIGMKGHNGQDNSAWNGEPLYFSVEIEGVTWHSTGTHIDADGGIGVDVVSDQEVEIDGVKSYIKFRFWHLKDVTVKEGEAVRLGQLIGHCDNTGASSGSHLHWSLKRCTKEGWSTESGNGYYGATDFSEKYENVFVLDVLQVKTQALSAIDLARKTILQVKNWLNENFNSSK